MTLECALCGAPVDGSGEHAICATCRGMAPTGVVVTPPAPLFSEPAPSDWATSAALAHLPLASERESGRRRQATAAAVRIVPDDAARDDETQGTIRYFPDLFISQLSTVFLVTCLISVLTIFLPASLAARANPSLTPANARPNWYFLFLYAFLHFVPTILGILAPIAGIVGLMALPFLDRNPERAPHKRILAIAACAVLVAGIVWLSVIGYQE